MIWILAIFATAAALLAFKKKPSRKKISRVNTSSRYMDKFQLLNKGEQELYKRLKEAAPALIVFSQVSMSQIFHITPDRKRMQLNEIGRKSVDFLLCREDTSILLAIELNGAHHEEERQKFSDDQKRKALESAGIPLVIVKPDAIPGIAELRKILAPYIIERKRNENEKQEAIQNKKVIPFKK